MRIPVFHLTGTRDESPGGGEGGKRGIVGHTSAAERQWPYRHTRHAPAYQLVFTDGDHMVFSGRLTGSRRSDPPMQDLVCRSSTAFWDTWLRGDTAAKHWLEDGGFAAALGTLGTFEHKSPVPR